MSSRRAAATLVELRRHLAQASLRPGPAATAQVSLGVPALDEVFNDGSALAALHEIYAPGTADLAAATGFAVGLAIRMARERPIVWIRQDMLDAEAGRLHPPGLVELGLDPARILLVRARDTAGVLRASAEAARCSALGAVLIEPWGEPRLLDLTASRRLALAAESASVMVLLLRASAAPAPSAARTRWQVRALPSRALEANAPGDPAFNVTLLRHRGGLSQCEWRVEWSRDRQCFEAESASQRHSPEETARPTGAGGIQRPSDATPLSQPVVPFPGDRPAATGSKWRRAG